MPQSTTAVFGDWGLRCVGPREGGPTQHICEVVQSIQVQGQAAPIAQIALGRLQKADPLRLTVVLPNNVSFAGGMEWRIKP